MIESALCVGSTSFGPGVSTEISCTDHVLQHAEAASPANGAKEFPFPASAKARYDDPIPSRHRGTATAAV